ncbi:XdhC/CoxI family protein [Roseburia hominis]
MTDFYHIVEEMNPNRLNMALTVLEGEALGQKALASDGSLVWESVQGGFFSEHREEIAALTDNCLKEFEGTRVFCELLGSEKKLVICGGGHVSIPVIQMGRMTGFHVTVLEDRPKFADNARRAGANEVICESFEEGLKRIEGDLETYFVIVTRGHRYDQACLESIAKKQHAYIGMIGSKKRVAVVKESVLEHGANPDVIAKVYTPIGLRIGAETPEEIAVAIMAEIIEVKNKCRRSGGYPKEILKGILNEETEKEPKILATIVAKKGAAPRGTGTKMLVLPDGTCIGTIGGGCVEAEILRQALVMIREGERRPRLCNVDLTGRFAEEDGMVCGGIIDVLLEIV